MTAFLTALAAVAGVLLLAASFGYGVTLALFARHGRTPMPERLGWAFAIGCLLLAVQVPIVFLFGAVPGWGTFLAGAVVLVLLARALAVRARQEEPAATERERTWVLAALATLLGLGCALYALRALTEPMWSNDFLAIWGFKGKTIFFADGVPARLTAWPSLAFSHPEYPLGLPFLYAGLSFLTGQWDDHAMALLFPFFQAATLCVLFGWLRRRGASLGLALSAAALVALCEPLYSAFLTGMAEVPLSFALVLFGTALADGTNPGAAGALRRLSLASCFLSAFKNEGLFLAAAGGLIAVFSGVPARLRIAAAALGPALAVYGLHVAWRGRLPLADFDFTLFTPERAGQTLSAAAKVPGLPGWLGLAALGVLVAIGRRDAGGDRMLLLAGIGLLAYLALPVFAVRGPSWLIETTLARTASALVPLVAAGIGVRLMQRSEIATRSQREG